MKTDLERSLQRQLIHAGLSVETPPTDINQWQAFLENINKAYKGNREARYMLERSLDQSSKEMRELYDNLKTETEQRVRALQESEEKSRFMANMSHEIRTPIHGILGSLEIVKGMELNGKQLAFVNTAFSSAESLLSIINNILDFSKIRAKQLELETIQFNMHDLVEEINSILTPTARNKNLNISCLIHQDVPWHLKGDPVKLRQILVNLLSNAIKFTQTGQVRTEVSMLYQQNENVGIRFEVTDTGIGIPQNMLQNIFGAFVQADGSTTREYGGTGLGLTIVRELTTAMGGQVFVESKVGEGSRFWVDIELSLNDPVSFHVVDELKDLKILAIDYEESHLSIIDHYLSAWGAKVDIASSAQDALKKLARSYAQKNVYDLIILEWFMPNIEGLKLSQALSTDTRFKFIPKVILGSQNKKIERDANNIMVTLATPIRKSVLRDSVLDALSKKVEQTKLTHSNEPLIYSNEKSSRFTDVLLAEDNEINAMIAITILEQIGLSVKHVLNGQQAIEEAQKGLYKIILMDMHMPIKDGYTAAKEIRVWEKQSNLKQTPIIALTANALANDREKCLLAGMNDYLPKPVKKDRLQNVIKHWLQKETLAV
jgi:signal transduction histidine kinase/CheY-like chemotaxis protein